MKKDNMLVTSAKKVTKFSKKVTKTVTENLGITEEKNKSRIELKMSNFYAKFLFWSLLTIISVGALLPYAYYLYSKEKYQIAYIDNKRLVFNGKVVDAYITFIGGYVFFAISITALNIISTNLLPLIVIENERIKTLVDTLITTLINTLPTIFFSTFILARLSKWQQKNLHLISSVEEKSYYEFHIVKSIILAILRKLLKYISFGLGNPAEIKLKEYFLINRYFCSEKRLKFDGSMLSSYKWFLWRFYLVFITFGFYLPIYVYKYNNWVIMNTHINENQSHDTHKINIF